MPLLWCTPEAEGHDLHVLTVCLVGQLLNTHVFDLLIDVLGGATEAQRFWCQCLEGRLVASFVKLSLRDNQGGVWERPVGQ